MKKIALLVLLACTGVTPVLADHVHGPKVCFECIDGFGCIPVPCH